jgi:organic radical activating enzyme
MIKYKINEIFYSIQGEGFHTGTPAIFIRFAGCNLNCPWCDTDFSIKEELNWEQMVERFKNIDCNYIILTGGEPSYQNIDSLINDLQSFGYCVAVETNGFNFSALCRADWITFSPKDTTKNYGERYWNELKIVYTEQDMEPYKKYMTTYNYIQPCDIKGKMNIEKCVEFVKNNPKWRLSCQIHKLINIK